MYPINDTKNANLKNLRKVMTEIVILSGARTAIGTFGGSLSKVSPIDMGTAVIKKSIERAGIDPSQIDHVAMGHVINTESRDAYLSRVASIKAGISTDTPAMNVNRLCGSGLQAIVSVTQSLMLGAVSYTHLTLPTIYSV